MTEKTKACNLTVGEIERLIEYHGNLIHNNTNERMERLMYLNKRLKSFNETEVVLTEATKGWSTNNG